MALAGDYHAADVVLKASTRRSKLLGLDEPSSASPGRRAGRAGPRKLATAYYAPERGERSDRRMNYYSK
jgi:hypothetical protein